MSEENKENGFNHVKTFTKINQLLSHNYSNKLRILRVA